VVVDEAHRSAAGEYAALVERYANSVVIGLTATPTRGDGRGLGDIYQSIVQSVPVTKLVEDEYLVPVRAFAPYVPDLKGVSTSGGEYNAKQLGKRLGKVELVGDIVAHWKKHAYGKRTICFAPLCQVSRHIVEQFRNAGIRAEHLDGRMEIEEREAILARHQSGETTILCNVAVLCEGYDDPAVECIILYRPTLRLGSFLQMAGRVLRPSEGKDHALLLDHAGAVLRHGWPDEDREWVLEETKKQKDVEEDAEREGKRRSRHLCPDCHCLFYGRMDCPNCGRVLRPFDRPSDKAKAGILTEVDRKKAQMTEEQKQRLWTSCLYRCLNTGKKVAVAAHMYKSHAGELPWESRPRPEPLPVGRENWQKQVRDVWPEFGKKRVVT
jgi:superfamily II DNA or RNA helicase